MPQVAPSYTIADLDAFPEDGNRYELLGGVLLVTPAPGPPHQAALARLTVALASYLGPSGLALPVSPGVIQADHDTQLEPDLLVVPAAVVDQPTWRAMSDWWLAVEVSGRTSRVYDRDFKTGAYLRLGVRQVWRIDLRDRALYRSRRGGAIEVPETADLTWHPSEMPFPLRLDLAAILRRDNSA